MPDALNLSFEALSCAEARRRLRALLADAGREPAGLDARLLLEAATGLDHAALLRDPDTPLGQEAARGLADLAARRLAGEPLSRVLGQRTFCGLTLEVRPGVLDPREDTGAVVTLACDLRFAPGRILDLGTGSGALLCALLQRFPQALGVGVDRSVAACGAARANANSTGVGGRALILRGDWSAALHGPFDLIVSNPPYVARGDLSWLPDEVRLHDPTLALDGGLDGLDAYRAILADIGRIAAPGALLVVETGAGMRARVEALVTEAGLAMAGVARDNGGHDRALAAQIG